MKNKYLIFEMVLTSFVSYVLMKYFIVFNFNETYGIISYILSLIPVLTIFLTLNFVQIIQINISQEKKLNKNLLVYMHIVFIIMSIVLNIVGLILKQNIIILNIIILITYVGILNLIVKNYYIFMKETKKDFLFRCLTLFYIVPFMILGLNGKHLVIKYIVLFLFFNFISVLIFFPYKNLNNKKSNYADLIEKIKFLFLIFPHNLAYNASDFINKQMILIYFSFGYIGIYTSLLIFQVLMNLIVIVFKQMYVPLIYTDKGSMQINKKKYDQYLYLFLFLLIIIISYKKIIILILLSKDFIKFENYVYVMVIYMVIKYMYDEYATIFIIKQRQKLLSLNVLPGLITLILCNLLIPKLGLSICFVSLLMSEIVMFIMLLIEIKYLKINEEMNIKNDFKIILQNFMYILIIIIIIQLFVKNYYIYFILVTILIFYLIYKNKIPEKINEVFNK